YGSMSRNRWTWSSATARVIAALSLTTSRPFQSWARASATSAWKPAPNPSGCAPPTSPTTTSGPWSTPTPPTGRQREDLRPRHRRRHPPGRGPSDTTPHPPAGRAALLRLPHREHAVARPRARPGRVPRVRPDRAHCPRRRRREDRMTHAHDRALPRAVRQTMPMARDVLEEVAKLHGVCIRPIPLRRLDIVTGKSEIIDVPCGATLDSKCPPCAKRNRQLRVAQCREGWHLDTEPAITPDEPNDEQRWLVEFRADMQAKRDAAEQAGDDTADLDAVLSSLDAEINAAGMRGSVTKAAVPKRSRSTRRRQDAPDLPKRKMTNTTLGRTFQAPDGKTYRPSLFVTLTLPSYGKVRDGAPIDPDTYDYRRAARDALHFSKLVDRFVQNLRRVAGYDVQYFAAVEPQKRLAPHLHMAIRGTLPRAEIKQIVAATYHQVWWPQTDEVRFEGDQLPVWDEEAGYLAPTTGEVLPTWGEALDAHDEDAEPLHVLRFGDQVDVQGVLAGTPDADQCIRYLSKYLTKSIGDSLD